RTYLRLFQRAQINCGVRFRLRQPFRGHDEIKKRIHLLPLRPCLHQFSRGRGDERKANGFPCSGQKFPRSGEKAYRRSIKMQEVTPLRREQLVSRGLEGVPLFEDSYHLMGGISVELIELLPAPLDPKTC